MKNDNLDYEAIKNAVESIQKIPDSLDSTAIAKMSEFVTRAGPVVDGLSNVFSQLNALNQSFNSSLLRHLAEPIVEASTKEPVISGIAKLLASWQEDAKIALQREFLFTMSEKKWPLFLVHDNTLMNDVLDAYRKNSGESEIVRIVSDFFERSFLTVITEKWRTNTVIRKERIPILMEALEMHKAGRYYSAVSILMCQVYGLASEIIDIEKKYALTTTQEDKARAAEVFGLNMDSVDSEKGKVTQSFMFVRHNFFAWKAVIMYLNSEILCSSESKRRWATQPLRNKICHGDQLNYGTQEHSIKAILVIDMLIELALEIEYAGKKQSEMPPTTDS